MKPNSCGKLALPDFICNTSPFQHLYQLGCLEILPALLRIPLTGTLGLLLDAKKMGLVPAVMPLLNQLDRLRFRVSTTTRAAVLKLAGE
jgi:hypothetical protein